jgi:hypothetical protein
MTARRVAGALVVVYILVQIFQHIVFLVLPEPESAAATLAQAGEPLNLARAALMLLSFFGLAYAFVVVCLASPGPSSIFALFGLLLFCGLEIGLRSIELFWLFLQRPSVDAATTFGAIQGALYFPLMLGQALGSAVLALSPAPRGRRDLLLRVGFGANALRLLLRLAGIFLHISALDALSGGLYLPLVFLVYAPIAVWLLQRSVDFPGQPR